MAERSPIAERRSPLAGLAPAGAIAIGDIELRLVADAARLVVRIAATDQAIPDTVAGFDLAAPINRWTGSRDRLAVRLGPDEWLLIETGGNPGNLAADVTAALASRRHAVFDQSHGFVGFTIAGAAAADVINAGCPLDLSDAVFPVGAGTRTIAGKAGIAILKVDATPTYRIEVARSFAAYVTTLMIDTARGR